MASSIDFSKAEEILASYGKEATFLIAIMQQIQSEYKYLPAEVLEYIAAELGISVAKVYSVATFYENFSLDPKGKHVIRICDGTACQVGSDPGSASEGTRFDGKEIDDRRHAVHA